MKVIDDIGQAAAGIKYSINPVSPFTFHLIPIIIYQFGSWDFLQTNQIFRKGYAVLQCVVTKYEH